MQNTEHTVGLRTIIFYHDSSRTPFIHVKEAASSCPFSLNLAVDQKMAILALLFQLSIWWGLLHREAVFQQYTFYENPIQTRGRFNVYNISTWRHDVESTLKQCCVKKRLLQQNFRVNFAKFFRAAFLRSCRWQMFCKKRCSKHLYWDLFFNKVVALRPTTFFPAQEFSCEFCQIFKTTFFIEHFRWLLLFLFFVRTLLKNWFCISYRWKKPGEKWPTF